ncbi:CLUMA_CG003052, isoform A [Clunio marinus]|uniref:CLUMA_CG003052, isoform A n=1 Tax=Clunio marinus TaxID=568069 RepID=A0A1J1HML6_9DIPT|nr:CLUMA_CG003052, isoform A [Clunio marinus]
MCGKYRKYSIFEETDKRTHLHFIG